MAIELTKIQSRSAHSDNLDETVVPPSYAESYINIGEGAKSSAQDGLGGRGELTRVEVVASSQSSQTVDAIPSSAVPVSTPALRRKATVQFATLCWALFLAGWNDGSIGPLLPRMQEVYNVNFTLVSMTFVGNCIGFILGAASNIWLTDRFGLGKVMVIASVVQTIGYAVDAPAPPFPVFVLGYALNGFGIALQEAGANTFVSSMKGNRATKFGIMHGVYGVGAFSAPLVATQFSQLARWSFHFLVSFGIAVVNLALLIAVFRFKDQDACLAESGQGPTHDAAATTTDADANKYKQMFRQRAMHVMALFILVYVGVEVTLGGWIVTYVIDLRGGGPSSGYIASGFFGGLTFGRIALIWVNQKIGERRVIFLYGALAIGLELVVWFVPSLVGGAVVVSLVGVLLGPIYPMVINYAGHVFPTRLLGGSIGWIAGFGQAGSAILPFIAGTLASKTGIKSLQPLLVSMMSFMVFLWALVPNVPRRIE
ncbi:major facilitator superfamily domain-containing protein [Daedaleopsis nitida]|nr:major facilitator superfamily domain-containing protein [Daedaleopsis nitida]